MDSSFPAEEISLSSDGVLFPATFRLRKDIATAAKFRQSMWLEEDQLSSGKVL
jgi:hypothetical protein